MTDAIEPDAPSRYLIGIDLGTTNSALAYVDTAQSQWAVRDFAIPQLVAPATLEDRPTLPSFHYEAAAGEFAAGGLRLPWSKEDPTIAVGAFARDHGASAVQRLVVSAKSWLSHSGVDRTAGLLPWHAAPDVQKLSPVEVSARYLAHLRAAWDARFPEHPMEEQDVILTAPASFDEVARELTVEAARKAGLTHLVLVEEPQAAFYAWISAAGEKWDRMVKPGQKILICDVGGGTTDFTLIRVRPASGAKVLFHRVAVGEHLILGGDNFDLAIAHYVEKKLGKTLEPRAFGPLVRGSRVAKETLLGADPPGRFVMNISSGGSKLIGGASQVELTREEIQSLLLEGFLPRVQLEDVPQSRRSGFQEFGLPYARDAAITRYLAAFLSAHRHAGQRADEPAPTDHDAARPDLVLFNGGLFESPILRERLLEVLESWFGGDRKNPTPVLRYSEEPDRTSKDPALRSTSEPASSAIPLATKPLSRGKGAKPWKPIVLKNDRLDLAVARGAAYYGMVRRGRGVRISGGLAHSYYIGVESDAAEARAICLAPAGVEEGQTVDVAGRVFNLLIRQPVEFPLYSSSTRTTDAPGDLLIVDPEQMTALPPIRTVLQSGRKAASEAVQVRLHAKLTEIGTLDIWFAETRGDRTWRLQFDVRAASRPDIARHEGIGEAQGVLDEGVLAAARERIAAAFRRGGERCESLVKKLEEATGLGRHDWPSTLLRGLWETLLEAADGRRLSEIHEARWLNLTGFCLRPGYGLAADDWRVAQTWKLFPAGVTFAKNELVRAEWHILWRRLSGGMSAGQQRTLAEPLVADWRDYFRKAGSNVRGRSPTFQFGPHESAEVWRLLGGLELLPVAAKLEIGEMLLNRLPREQAPNLRDAELFALGRLGARAPMYGPLNMLISAEDAERWARRLIEGNPSLTKELIPSPGTPGDGEGEGSVSTSGAPQPRINPHPGPLSRIHGRGDIDKAAFALVQLCRRTGDRYRDVADELRASALDWMAAQSAPDHWRQLVREGGSLHSDEQRIVFGESLPRGLRIE